VSDDLRPLVGYVQADGATYRYEVPVTNRRGQRPVLVTGLRPEHVGYVFGTADGTWISRDPSETVVVDKADGPYAAIRPLVLRAIETRAAENPAPSA
jgi:hypothetical protein